MNNVMVAAVQFSMTDNEADNIAKAVNLIKKAAKKGANVILLPELFATPYFCKVKNAAYFAYAKSAVNHPMILKMQELAKELSVVLPISFFEHAGGDMYYNSLVMIDADGKELGLYRKCHIPRGPGYEENFYFTPGNLGFRVFKTRFGILGCGICWDQWFPEAARAMTLLGAQILFYPTAIGSEPKYPDYDSKPHWQRVMQGHAAANMVPIVAANRVGVEIDEEVRARFYGSSFITDNTGGIITQAGRDTEEILFSTIDIDTIIPARDWWGLFRDRRVDLY